ncbi:MAG: MBG domain-containing protein, partial [Verrucomicrobiota bacterium]
NVPTNAGSYTVIGTITDANYQGSATNTLVIAQASGSVTLGSLNQTYTGTAKPATVTTTPTGLTVSFTYNGSANVPTNAGSYTVIGTITDANYQGSATNTLVIAQASGSVTLGSLSQTYTGTAKPATATTTPTGLTVSFTYNGSANVPTNAGSYTVIGTINDVNYQGSTTNTLVIAQASGSVTLGSLSQTYTGTAKPATATTTPTGLAVSFTYNGSANAPTNAGSYTVIGTITDANYQGSATNTLVINAATLTYTANAASMTYGSAVPGLSGSVSGFVGTDNQGNATTGTLTFTPAATSTSGVGSYAINGTGLTANNGNYTFVQATGNATALTINALPVNLTGTRSYDGTTTAAAGILSVANKVGSDNVTVVSGNGTLAGANVGSEAITSLGTLALGGTAAGNYTLASASGSVNITVSALALTVTNLLALDNVYDGTTNATLDATNAGLAGVLNGDSVTLVTSNAVAYFADKNVGTNKPVTVTGLALGSTAAANYTLADPTNVTANITAAGLTVAGVTAASKVYDGTTNAQLNGTATLNGEVSGDDVSLVTDGVNAAFAGPNVGTGIPVTVSGYAITGADAGNYTLTQPSALAADITAATLTITATANTKTYDGTTSALATPTASGLQDSDTVTGLAETYDTKDMGTGKTLSVNAYTVNDGNSGNNYIVNTATSTAGVISKATLTITAAANTKTYDDSTSAATTPTVSGLQGSDTVTGLAETYDTKHAGTGKTLSVSAYTVNDSNSGNNYTVSTATSTAGVISQASLTITAAANTKTYDGSISASATPTVSGLQGSDSVSGLAETYDTKNVGSSKTLSVNVYTVNDGNSGGNYTVSTVASTAGVINPAMLTVTADNKSKMCGQPNPPLTASYNGFVGGESANVLTSPVVLNTTAATSSGEGTYPITADGAAAANYTINYVSGQLTVDPVPQLTGVDVNVNGNNQFIISWPTVTGRTYQLEYKDDLMAAAWTPQGNSLPGNDAMAVVTNNISDSPQRFFRVQVQ